MRLALCPALYKKLLRSGRGSHRGHPAYRVAADHRRQCEDRKIESRQIRPPRTREGKARPSTTGSGASAIRSIWTHGNAEGRGGRRHCPHFVPGYAPLFTSLIAGDIELAVAPRSLRFMLPILQAGTLKALVITGPARSQPSRMRPPARREPIPVFISTQLQAGFVPASTPKDIVIESSTAYARNAIADARVLAR